jgi:hypothetical protein
VAGEQYFRESATHALAGFQLVEEALKSYIGQYRDAVRRFLPEKLTYRYARQDVQEAALGKLVNVFAKVTPNDKLVAELRGLVKARDDLAHKAFVNLYGPKPSEEEFRKRGDAFIQVARRLGNILGELHEESVRLVAVRP